MDYKQIKDYANKRYDYPYPTDSIDPALKRQKSWYLATVQAMICDYASNYCYIPFEFGMKRSFATLRAYATGQQSPNKLKDSLIGRKKRREDGTYPTKMNISWDTYYIMSKMFDIIRERNMTVEFDVDVTCIDEDSLATKDADRQMLKYMIHPQTQAFLKATGHQVPHDVNPKAMGIQNQADVDLYFETGGYSTQREIACVAACQKTKMVSNYKVIQDATFDDLITVALTGWKTYIEKSTKLPKIRKCYIDRCVIPYSELNDFSDNTRAAEIRIMTIADIWKENPSLTAENLLYLAEKFQWLNQSFNYATAYKSFLDLNRFNSPNVIDLDPISRVRVMVLDAQWLSADVETNLKNERSDGSIFYKEVPYYFEQDAKSKKNGDEVIRKNVIRKYEAQWVIGTEMFLNFGQCTDVVYYGPDGNKVPRLDYFFVKTGNASLVERCIALIDDIDLAIIKQRNTLATVPAAPGIAIQKDLIENVFLNGKKQQPDDVLTTLMERGILYYNSLDDQGKPLYMAGGQKPIEFLDVTKIVGVLTTYGNIIVEKVNEIREVLGIPQGTDGSTPQQYDGLGKTRLSMQASNAALFPTFNAYENLFRPAFDDIIKKWQIVASDHGMKIGFSPLGTKAMKILQIGKDFSNAEFNIDVQLGINDEQKKELLASITQQKALGDQSNGQQGLNPAEFMFIYDRVLAGNIREAMYVMAQIQQKKTALAAQQKQIDYQNNAQLQQQSAQQKQQGDQQNIATKAMLDGHNEAITQLLKGYFAENKTLMAEYMKGKNKAEQPISGEAVGNQVAQNNQKIEQLISPPPITAPQTMGENQQQQDQQPQPQTAA